MAKLQSGKLSLEIKYKDFVFGEITYEIAFLWNGESMINDAVLKRSSEWWASRRRGTFLFSNEPEDAFLNLIEKAIETNEPVYWEPIEPDIKLAIYPEFYFPLIDKAWDILYLDKKLQAYRKAIKKAKEEQGKQPFDTFALVVFVDTYNFAEGGYSSQGLALQLATERQRLEEFHKELSAEYLKYKEEFKIDKYFENINSSIETDLVFDEIIEMGE